MHGIHYLRVLWLTKSMFADYHGRVFACYSLRQSFLGDVRDMKGSLYCKCEQRSSDCL